MIGELLWNTFLGESILTPIDMSVEDQMRYRHKFVEFDWNVRRLISDTVRKLLPYKLFSELRTVIVAKPASMCRSIKYLVIINDYYDRTKILG